MRNFMFYSAVDNWSFDEVGQAFVQVLKEKGHKCNWIRWHESPAFTTAHLQWKHKRRWLAAQLKQAPKPLALFCATDDHALEVLETCESEGFAVPEEISIIGMDNSILAVDAMRTPISSVDRNLELMGYRGAELLNDLMHGRRAATELIRVPVAGLIIRKSSDLMAVRHPGVARSLRFIWEHFHEPISVKDLVGVAGMSRRGLYTAFLEHVGRSPGEELHRMRIERAKRLLLDSDHKMETLAHLCGYQSVTGFWVAFKQDTGLSPKRYREKQSARLKRNGS
jgi:LacI family transcriptional regulator